MTPAKAFDLAVRHHREGRVNEAELLYRQVVEQDPLHSDALFLLGGIALASGRDEAALGLLERAVSIAPHHPIYQSNLGMALRRLGRLDQAIAVFARAVELKPDLAESYLNLGLALLDRRESEGAVKCLTLGADLKPDHFALQAGLGRALARRGEVERAVAHHQVALAIRNESEAVRRGLLELLGRSAAPVAGAQLELARSLRARGEGEKAVSHFQAAIALAPPALEAVLDLAELLQSLGRLDGAEVMYRRLVEARPEVAPTHHELGLVLARKQRLDEAAACFRRALERDPGHARSLVSLGTVLKDTGHLGEATACYRRALAANPDDHGAHSNVVYALGFAPDHDPAGILAEARGWQGQHAEQYRSAIRPHPNDRNPDRRVRIGYVSPDFRDHCQALFTVPLLSNHDRDRFEISCYSSVAKPDAMTERLGGYTDTWREVTGLSDDAVADIIRKDQVDILVDLTMHMADNRLLVFARKPAPVQVAWLAYPGTTGLGAIDYRITDRHIDPPGSGDDAYAERSVRLPDTFWCYAPLTGEPAVTPLPALRNGFVTFGCLNAFCKTNSGTFELWARVLRGVPGSRLILLCPEGATARRTLGAFEALGVDPGRLHLVGRMPAARYLATYGKIDLCLDTFPYNGHTTSLDAYWMGVPVITITGATVVARAGHCYAMNLDLPELAAPDADEFVARAVALAGDLPRLSELRAGLRRRMEACPLMDGPRFARNLEDAYRSMWRAWCADERRT